MTTNHMLGGLPLTGRAAEDLAALIALEAGGWDERLAAIAATGVPMNAVPSPMVKEGWQFLLVPGLRKLWVEGMSEDDSTFRRTVVFPIDSSVRAKESFQGVGELGSDAWNQFDKTGRVPYDGLNPLWPYELVHRRYAMGIQVERELVDDNLYAGAPIPRDLASSVTALGRSAAQHRERSAAALFNNAFTDTGNDAEGHSVTGPDGVGLVSTAHKRSPSDSTTQSNEFTLALTVDNVKTVRLAMNAWTDDRGHLNPANPTVLLVPPALADAAEIINTSVQDPYSANNTPNTERGKWRIVVWPWLTDTNRWFVIDDAKRRQQLIWLDRILPEFALDRDFDTLMAKYRGYYRFSRGWSHWTWIAGSEPS